MIQRNVEAGHDLCMRINRAQNASIPSPLRAGGSASADHGVRLTKRTNSGVCPSFSLILKMCALPALLIS